MTVQGRIAAFGLGIIVLAALCSGEETPEFQEREYLASAASVRVALEKLGATKGSHLPALDGFVKSEGVQLDHFERPYYDFKTEVAPGSPGKTVLKVKATISAWYAEPGTEGGYRVLESNGRLESDLLDRVGDYLKKNPPSAAEAQNIEQQIADTRKQRETTEQRVAELEAQLKSARSSPTTATTDQDKDVFVSVSSVQKIFSAPSENAPVISTTEPDDEFEVVERKGNYVGVRLDEDRTGWLLRSQTRPAWAKPDDSSPSSDSFHIVKQGATTFDGDWLPLKGKKVLYLWARPVGSSLNHSAATHLSFAQATFAQHYREAAHDSKNTIDGWVIIFLDEGGGVAAATLEDAKLWRAGALTNAAFLKKCSFDPHSEFAEVPTKASPLKTTHRPNGGL